MKISVLASGSKGNVTYIETKKHKILFDLGMNISYIKRHLDKLGVNPYDINYVFISHNHFDHVSGLQTFLKHYKPTLCLNPIMIDEIIGINDYENIQIFEEKISLDDIKIETIKTSHDSKDSRGFIIESNGESLVIITDTGYIHHKHFEKLANKNYYLLESNHDTNKLMNGPYPNWVKKRVLSNYGHLSNKDASIYLAKLIGTNTKKIVLMHLSENNNTEELALKTIKETFNDYEIEFDNIICAKQKECCEVNS